MRRTAIGLMTLGLLAPAGCLSVSVVEGTNFQTGTYQAELFAVTPDGQASIDVLGAGGSLTISIDRSGVTSGTLTLPAVVTGGNLLTASMAGTANISGLTVQFDQTADTFVRQVTWARIEQTIQLNQVRIGAAVYDVALVRQ